MKLLVINAGSSTLKFQIYKMPDAEILASGNIERIATKKSFFTLKTNEEKQRIDEYIANHKEGVNFAIKNLIKNNIIKDKSEIKAVGHRTVSGAYLYNQPTLVTDKVISDIKGIIDFAPLHLPGTLMGIEACQSLNVPNVLVFDTGFHSTIPKVAYTYALKKEDIEKYHIRKYGFHGQSHQYVTEEITKLFGTNLKLINCHLGSGASIAAIKNGKCQDTSMGLTPLEGLVMGTRCGDIDPSIVGYLAVKKGQTAEEVIKYLTNECGLKGLYGSADMRDVNNAMSTNSDAKLAMDVFVYRIVKYIGSYVAVLNGVDIISFTAGIGEKDPLVRKLVCEKLTYLGVEIDEEKNAKAFNNGVQEISKKGSKVKVMVVPTDEEIVIAKATYNKINKK